MRYTIEFRESKLAKPMGGFTLGVCDDGREHFLWAYNLAFLQRFDLESSDHAGESGGQMFLNAAYAIELRHDGTRVELLCEGRAQTSIESGTRQQGALFLCMGSDCPLRIERLEIEGRLGPDGLARLEQAWIERELASFR